ncbi:SURF1 family protein [Bosea sp. (in: a-proteobacteria)]|uniref:SURF1 family protein n=1 Tax=Bosea sp. (in: a-proteobacteria) TaxID=1871050 RepID=UPI00262CFAB0|nr:SURF1 family cytochrome oxidase biogenesis protein [Bosea sp. (in: a-proteobacteria)]MCO5092337.1 SURF1 family protein [Bosea sp. (in: a-proteobacteria)]
MTATRKPGLLLPTLATIIGVLILCGLGIWQLQRMGEKHAYLERLQREAAGAPAPMPPSSDWGKLDAAALDLAHVVAKGRYIDDKIAGVRTTIGAGPPGSRGLSGFGRWIFQAFRLEDGGVILVNRGFVPEERLGQIGPLSGADTVTGFLRAPEARNSFTPEDLPAIREFYTRDPAAIAAALGQPPAPFYLEAAREGDGLTPPAGVDVGELIARVPDNHLQYALTWFGLALTLIGVFAAFAWQARRGPAAH